MYKNSIRIILIIISLFAGIYTAIRDDIRIGVIVISASILLGYIFFKYRAAD